MKFQYLGTAAAEGLPALFCHCETCKTARKNGNKDIRGRSGGVINDRVIIDFPPDIYFHSIRFNLDLGNMDALFFTHSHSDHCDIRELEFRRLGGLCRLEENRPPLKVFGNDTVRRMFENEGYHRNKESYEFTEAQFYTTYEVGDIKVTPLRAAHDTNEKCMIYLVEYDGKYLIYGNDTTYFHEEVFEFLSGKHMDIVSLDCCSGLGEERTRHMGFIDCVRLRNEMFERGIADAATNFIITHFSHGGKDVIHSKLEEAANAENFTVAYDGRIINI